METVKYRVYSENGSFREFLNYPTDAEYAEAGGVGEVESLPIPTGKTQEFVFEEISEAFSNEYRKLWAGLGYEAEWEIEQYARRSGHHYQPEAQAILDWRVNGWDFIEDAEITAETNVPNFISSLPVFTNPI